MAEQNSFEEIAFNEKKCKQKKKSQSKEKLNEDPQVPTPKDASVYDTNTTTTPPTPSTPSLINTPLDTEGGEAPKVSSNEKDDEAPGLPAAESKSRENVEETKTHDEAFIDPQLEKPKKKKKKKKPKPPPPQNDGFNAVGKLLDQDAVDIFEEEEKKKAKKKKDGSKRVDDGESPSDRKKQKKKREEPTDPKSDMKKKDAPSVLMKDKKDKVGDKKKRDEKRVKMKVGENKLDDSDRKKKGEKLGKKTSEQALYMEGVKLDDSNRKKGQAKDRSGRLPVNKKSGHNSAVPPKSSDDQQGGLGVRIIMKIFHKATKHFHKKSDDPFIITADSLTKPDVKAEYGGEDCKNRPPKPPLTDYNTNNTNNDNIFPNGRPFWCGYDSNFETPSVKNLVISRRLYMMEKTGSFYTPATEDPKKEGFDAYREFKLVNNVPQDPWAEVANKDFPKEEYIVNQTLMGVRNSSEAAKLYMNRKATKKATKDDSRRVGTPESGTKVKFAPEPTRIRIYERRKNRETITQEFKPGQVLKPEKKHKKHKTGPSAAKNEGSARKPVQ